MLTQRRPTRRGRSLAAAAAAVVLLGSGASMTEAHATPVRYQHACAAAHVGRAACLALVVSDTRGHPLPVSANAAAGLHPYMAADLHSAYRLWPQGRGANQTIGIVDAFDDPNAGADLSRYRRANNLPPCTTAGGCFRKVNQSGGTTMPPADPGWALEISLDLDMASAVCPQCRLLLVEANDNLDVNLGKAVDEAVKLGATVISNSYGGPEFTGQSLLAKYYSHPGVVVVAASGDAGYDTGGAGIFEPAAFPSVIAAGGTTLYRQPGGRGWAETAWPGSGSGCSAYVSKPSWQHDHLCGMRTIADVAAVADPATPVAVYDSFQNPGWVAVGGTSAASPIIAGAYALAGNGARILPGRYLYSHRAGLFDVTSGSTGTCGNYLCTAKKGYDGPTGLGTPDGTSAF